MKFLLVPGNNALSHLGKCLALETSLEARGHEVLLAVSRKHEPHVQHLGKGYRVLPDIQENDQSGYPTATWFRHPQRIADCIAAERNLIHEFQPDRVLGVFRFTLKASAHLAGVPFDSLTCGCMLPETPEVLGFAEQDPGLAQQRDSLALFYGFAAARTSQALVSLGLGPITDIRQMLKGERTFLWDFPAFSPLPALPNVIHTGPLLWDKWPHEALDLDRILANPRPLAILTFGTCVGSSGVALRLIRILRTQGYQVLLAAGGQTELLETVVPQTDVTVCRFAPLPKLLPHAALLACHGGQLTVFEGLAHRLPVLVMPFQAEQAHNGLCLERLGCGQRLVPSQHFLGNSNVYVEAFDALEDCELGSLIRNLVENPDTARHLATTQATLAQYRGLETMVPLLEEC